MTEISSRPAAPGGILLPALRRRGQERLTGTLRLDGDPGGRVVMREGRVIAASTPAAPGPESLMLRSGRITEADWSSAFSAAAPHGRMTAELLERRLLGAAAIEVLTQTAIADAVFAMALSGVRTCTVEDGGPDALEPLLPALPGLDVDRLVRETTRRLGAAADWRERGLTLQTRPLTTGDRPAEATARQILDRANGRRTARDIAFALGRGLYPVMADLAELLEEGLITVQPAAGAPKPATPAMDAADLPRRRSKLREAER